jgi:hypothetical protein
MPAPTLRRVVVAFVIGAVLLGLFPGRPVLADVPGRNLPRGPVPLTGTQPMELTNLTMTEGGAPVPYNCIDFPSLCAGCHGAFLPHEFGTYAAWSGENMASGDRDPVFWADQQIADAALPGVGDLCARCHGPALWLNGRTNPSFGGISDGRKMVVDPLISADAEGVSCEFCHRTIGQVVQGQYAGDPAYKMLAGLGNWPHTGSPYPQGPLTGNPAGDGTYQLADGMNYGARFVGQTQLSWSDVKVTGTYTGQTYGVYPPPFPHAGEIVVQPDGEIPVMFEVPVGPPPGPVIPDFQSQSTSPEHATWPNTLLTRSDFCGTCHDFTFPLSGMPEQRTYTEWRYSAYGDSHLAEEAGAALADCQDCHMSQALYPYSDVDPATYLADPTQAGYFPYAKDRASAGGAFIHRRTGANRDLPLMMKQLYPEIDIVWTGGATGKATTAVMGMLSSRDLPWDRAHNATEVTLTDAATVRIVSGPTYRPDLGRWECKVRVTNLSGHRLPSGFPDGRRLWIEFQVVNAGSGTPVYRSGYYDQAQARLSDNQTTDELHESLSNLIDSRNPAVMVYWKETASRDPSGRVVPSMSVLNELIVFDNRIPPLGYDRDMYWAGGTKFWNHDPVTYEPYAEPSRYADGQSWDEITYLFDAPPTAQLRALASAFWQSHTREYMDYLVTATTSNLKPQGPPNVFALNYPLTPNYLADVISLWTLRTLDGRPLTDTWAGVAYGAWLLTGKGEPFLSARDDTAVTNPPGPPGNVQATVLSAFDIRLDWTAVPGVVGYRVLRKVRVGGTWLPAAIILAGEATTFLSEGLVRDTPYFFKVLAYNAHGSTPSAEVGARTMQEVPVAPTDLTVAGLGLNYVDLAWVRNSDNELGFIIERQSVPITAPFAEVGRAGAGVTIFRDTTAQPRAIYNYRVAAYNRAGLSIYSNSVVVNMPGIPAAPSGLTASAVVPGRVELSWKRNSTDETGFHVERRVAGGTFAVIATVGAGVTAYSDTTVIGETTYEYRVQAFNPYGVSPYSNLAQVTTPPSPPLAPRNLIATLSSNLKVLLRWVGGSTNETDFRIERRLLTVTPFTEIAVVGRGVTEYVDGSAVFGLTYVYRVRAHNAAGFSPYSNEAQVTVKPFALP